MRTSRANRHMGAYPMAQTDGYVVQKSGDELLVYGLADNRAICLNKTASLVWDRCDGAHSVSDICRALEDEFGKPVEEDMVLFAIEKLSDEGLLVDGETYQGAFDGLSRREVVKRIGFGSLVALPIVSAVIAPKAAFAASGCGAPGSIGTPATMTTCVGPTASCITLCTMDAFFLSGCCSGMGVLSPAAGPCSPSACTCLCA